jgi:hypothetical protein
MIETLKPLQGLKIMFCIPGQSFSNNFLNCWDHMARFLHERKIDYGLSTGYTPIIHTARDKVLGISHFDKEKIPFQGKIDYDYILWIDSDTIFKPSDLENLVIGDRDVISGYCNMLTADGSQKYAVSIDGEHISQKTIDDYRNDKDCKCHRVMEVTNPCMGFLLIKKKVMDKLKYPFFEPKYIDDGTFSGFEGEDTGFFRKIREAGFKMYIHTNVRVGHEKTQII